MSKICIIGDAHFRATLPYSSYFEDGRKAEWDIMLSKIYEVAEGCDVVVQMGDLLNLKNNPSIVIDDVVKFLKGFGETPVHIIRGNHCMQGEKSALDFLKSTEYPTWHVYTEIVNNVKLGDVTASFVPYLTPSMVGAKDKEEGVGKAIEALLPADIMFAHQAISGASIQGQMVDMFNEIVFPLEEIEEKYGRIFAGHVHSPQELSNKTTVTGNIFPAEVGEDKKYIFVYDTETKLTEKIELPVRGVYKLTLPGANFGLIPVHSIVKCYITDRSVDVEAIRDSMSMFDASIIVEKYPSEREKMHFDQGALDLSLDNILKVYAEAKNVDYEALQRGMGMLK